MDKDAISAHMGTLLLKGYKMLGDSCVKCNNVLMQDRKGLVICVGCGGGNAVSTVTGGYGDETVDAMPRKLAPEQSMQSTVVSEVEEILLEEIKLCALRLQTIQAQDAIDGDINLNTRLHFVKHIKECAETIKTIQTVNI